MKNIFQQKRGSAPDALFGGAPLVKQQSTHKPIVKYLKGKRMASQTVQKFITQNKYLQQMRDEDLKHLEQQMKINVIENIFRQQKDATERDVRKVDKHLAKIERQINQKNANISFELSPSNKFKHLYQPPANIVKNTSKFGSISGGSVIQEKKLSHISGTTSGHNNDIEVDEIVRTREFQEQLRNLDVNAILRSQDQDDIQRTKLRLLNSNLGGTVMEVANQSKNNQSHSNKQQSKAKKSMLVSTSPEALKQQRQEQGQINMFKRNINNTEKLLLQFKCPSVNQSGSDLDPKRKHIIMKLCNDEGAYLNYKKGKIDFGIEKPQPKFQEKRNNRIPTFFSRRKKQSLDHPGDMVADPDEVVDRLYSPKKENIQSKKKSWLDVNERADLLKGVKLAQQQRNVDVLQKLKQHKEERDKLHEQIEAHNQTNNQKIQFSKEGISNIEFSKVQNLLEETLNKLHEQGYNNKSGLQQKQQLKEQQQNETSESDEDRDEQSGSDHNEVSISPEKRSLEKFREQLLEKKRLKKISDYQKRKEQRSKEAEVQLFVLSPTDILKNKQRDNNNQDILLIDDFSPRRSNHKPQQDNINKSPVNQQALGFAQFTLQVKNLSLNTSVLSESKAFDNSETQNKTPKVNVKDELKQKTKIKYKVPTLQMMKHPNYYIWGDPVHKYQSKSQSLTQNYFQNYAQSTRAQSQIPDFRQNSQLNYNHQFNNKRESAADLRQTQNQSRLSSNSKNFNDSTLTKPTTPQYITEPINIKFKPSTPKFPHPSQKSSNSNSQDGLFPSQFNKRGSVLYGLDNSKNSSKYISTLSNQNNLTLSKSQQLQQDLTKVKQFIQECLRNESDEGERQLEKQLIFEEIRHDRMKDICSFLEQHNYVSANQLALFLKKKQQELSAQREDIKDSIIDYKLGIMDPSREAAGIEKQQNIKKNVGKKLRYNKISYKV